MPSQPHHVNNETPYDGFLRAHLMIAAIFARFPKLHSYILVFRFPLHNFKQGSAIFLSFNVMVLNVNIQRSHRDNQHSWSSYFAIARSLRWVGILCRHSILKRSIFFFYSFIISRQSLNAPSNTQVSLLSPEFTSSRHTLRSFKHTCWPCVNSKTYFI